MAAALATLAVALPGKDISSPLLEVYWRALADLTDAELEAAATKALRACRFFPTPSELLDTLPEALILSAEDVRRVLPVRECIDVMREAFVALAEGRATVRPAQPSPVVGQGPLGERVRVVVDDVHEPA